MGVVFKPEELKDAVKDFKGQIVDADYGTEPFGLKGAPEIEAREQLCLKVETPDYEKVQYIWLPPSDKKLTKWAYFIEALSRCGALRDVEIKGKTPEERIISFGKSLIEMKGRFIEYRNLPSIARRKEGLRVTVMEEYYGKEEVVPREIREERVEL